MNANLTNDTLTLKFAELRAPEPMANRDTDKKHARDTVTETAAACTHVHQPGVTVCDSSNASGGDLLEVAQQARHVLRAQREEGVVLSGAQ